MTQESPGQSATQDDERNHDLSYVEAMYRRHAKSTNVILGVSLVLFVGCIVISLVALFIVGWEPIGVVGTKLIP